MLYFHHYYLSKFSKNAPFQSRDETLMQSCSWRNTNIYVIICLSIFLIPFNLDVQTDIFAANSFRNYIKILWGLRGVLASYLAAWGAARERWRGWVKKGKPTRVSSEWHAIPLTSLPSRASHSRSLTFLTPFPAFLLPCSPLGVIAGKIWSS